MYKLDFLDTPQADKGARRRALGTRPAIASLAFTLGLAFNSQAQTAPPETSAAPSAAPAPSASAAKAPEATPAAGQLTRAPELKRFVAAAPGAGAPSIDENTPVLLELTVQADGSVANVKVVSSVHPVLDEAAVAAVSQFLFSPAEVDGKTSAVRIQYEYVYEPEEKATPEPAPVVEATAPKAPKPVAKKPAPTGPVGKLEGKLLQSGTRKPIIGASVSLPELGLETMTDGEGRFSFDQVSAGKVKLVLSDSEHASVEDTEEVQANSITDVTYYAEPTGFEGDDLVAIGRQVKKQVVRREISIRELSTIPGTQGDALKAVQNLPGVARTNGDQLVLRGGGGSQVFVNGHPITTAFHFGGLRSTVGNGMIKSLEVTPGNYDARYGNANGGIIDIQTRRPADDGLHGVAQADLFDASVFIEGPVSDNATFALGGRRSYIDGVMRLALSDEDREIFSTAPRYYDYQATYDWQKGKHRFRVIGLGSQDRVVLLLDEPDESDPAARGTLDASARWLTVQALWDYRASDKTQISNGISFLTADFKQSLGKAVKLNFTDSPITWRTDLTHEISPWLTARAGIDATVQHTTFDVSVPRAPEEGQPNPNLSTQEQLNTKGNGTTYRPATYVAADVQLGPVLLIPAVRAEYFSKFGKFKGDALVHPRFDARWAITDMTTVKGGAGMYSARPELHQSNDVYGNPDVKPALSRHYSAGIEQRLSESVTFDAVGFYKDMNRRISPVADPTIKYDNNGKGRAYGGEFMLKHDPRERFYGWASYTVMRSERKESGENDYRLFDVDQTHNLNVVGQYRISRTWEVGARFRYVTGNPTTPVSGATYDSDADIYTPTYGRLNSERNAAFHQLDVRVDKHWFYDTWKLTAYLDVQNAYNQKNYEGVDYNYNYNESSVSPGLPIIPSLGIKGEF